MHTAEGHCQRHFWAGPKNSVRRIEREPCALPICLAAPDTGFLLQQIEKQSHKYAAFRSQTGALANSKSRRYLCYVSCAVSAAKLEGRMVRETHYVVAAAHHSGVGVILAACLSEAARSLEQKSKHRHSRKITFHPLNPFHGCGFRGPNSISRSPRDTGGIPRRFAWGEPARPAAHSVATCPCSRPSVWPTRPSAMRFQPSSVVCTPEPVAGSRKIFQTGRQGGNRFAQHHQRDPQKIGQ